MVLQDPRQTVEPSTSKDGIPLDDDLGSTAGPPPTPGGTRPDARPGDRMRYRATRVADVLVIEPHPHRDERGFFARLYCEQEFLAHGLDAHISQSSIAFNDQRGTVRGLHLQRAPFAETKVVRCIRGAMFAVAVDLRPGSPTFGAHVTTELTADDRRSLYVPKGCATGYQTLTDGTEVMYLISDPHVPDSDTGIHYADPTLAIAWPLPVSVISQRDLALPAFDARP